MLIKDLQDTMTTRWYADTIGGDAPPAGTGGPARGGATRIRYYEAIQTCLTTIVVDPSGCDRPSNAELRDAVVAEVGRRSTSTLYLLFRPDAANSMHSVHDPALRASQGCQDVVDNLIAEAKVWTCWPYRAGWLQSLVTEESPSREFAAETLVLVLADWAANNHLLAAELSYAPPVSAIEDLQTICARQVDTVAITEILSKVLVAAVDPDGLEPAAVLSGIHQDLLSLVAPAVSHVDQVVIDLDEALGAVEYLLADMPDADRADLASEIGPRLSYVLKLLLGRDQ